MAQWVVYRTFDFILESLGHANRRSLVAAENLSSALASTLSRSPPNVKKLLFHVVVLKWTSKKPTRLYFARAVALCASLTLLFSAVLHDVPLVAP